MHQTSKLTAAKLTVKECLQRTLFTNKCFPLYLSVSRFIDALPASANTPIEMRQVHAEKRHHAVWRQHLVACLTVKEGQPGVL